MSRPLYLFQSAAVDLRKNELGKIVAVGVCLAVKNRNTGAEYRGAREFPFDGGMFSGFKIALACGMAFSKASQTATVAGWGFDLFPPAQACYSRDLLPGMFCDCEICRAKR